MTFSVIPKSCSKALTGKTYLKAVALPSILYGSINVLSMMNHDKEIKEGRE